MPSIQRVPIPRAFALTLSALMLATACAPVGARESAIQVRNSATRIRKKSEKFICRTSIVAQNQPPGTKIELMF